MSTAVVGQSANLTYDAVVDEREYIADDVVLLTLRRPGRSAFPGWRPGAHIDLVLDNGLVRQYSLCGDPDDDSCWQVAVHRAPAGRGGSAFVHDAVRRGSELVVSSPRNHFELVVAPEYLFLAGGIGITPLIPMMAETRRAGARWRLVYGGRSRAAMAFADELAGDVEHVDLWPQDDRGLIDLDAALRLQSAESTVYCCGPEAMLQAVEERTASWAPGRVHVERFVARLHEPVTSWPIEVELRRSGTTFTVPADRSILEVAEEHGFTLPSSCREGLCGTCETAVLGGVPDHRDDVLTEDERATNAMMMICCSRALSASLVLDI